VGAIFGVALYFLLASGLLPTQAPSDSGRLYYYGIIAFFAGFSERFTSVTFGQAEQLITGGSPTPPPDDPPPTTTNGTS
jgi:hypothetical protein